MADPFALVNRSLERSSRGRPAGGRPRPLRNPDDPKDVEHLRAMHPDFDEVMVSGQLDYRTRCQQDANFARSFGIPPVVEPARAFAEHTNSVDSVCWGPEPGQFVSASHDATLRLWDAESGGCTRTLRGHPGGVYHCCVASSGRLIASCCSGAVDNALVWQWPQGKVCLRIQGHRRSVVHATFSSDSSSTATVDQEGSLAIHDLGRDARRFHRTLHLGAANGSSFCWEDPNLLCTAGSDGFLQLLDLREHLQPPVWQLPSAPANSVRVQTTLSIPGAHDGHAVHALEFADRTTLFSGGADHKLKRWDLRMAHPWAPSCVGEFLGHTSPVRCLALAPDRRLVLTGCEDGSLRVWPADAERLRRGRGSAVRALIGHQGLVSGCAWRGDGGGASVLASSWDQTVRLFRLGPGDLGA